MSIVFNKKKQEEVVFSDISKDFPINPIRGSVLRKTNSQAIKESIKNLILTNRGERLMNPNVGSSIKDILFENMSADKEIVAKEMITEVLSVYESNRIVVLDVDLLFENYKVTVTILYRELNIEEPTEYAITIDRVR